ncbi:MAG: type VI secretion system membrane subunit TssM [Planctomycetota bacterium]|jgi:type VI secretion system IcmF/VasK family protein|nr:type VI secretion system membrane subunit TssM [Planctomycetota bacterium]
MGQAMLSILAVVYLVLAAVIWGVGLLMSVSLTHLVVATTLAVVPVASIYLVMRILAIRKEQAFEKRITAQGAAAGEGGSEMQEQFHKGLKLIRESHFSRTALTSLPWYVIIGAPGAGKSTAVRESGLSFPSVGRGLRSFRGVGGTRNCDWWITEEAFFLDTAGRYTTRSDDRDEWFGFLDLLKRNRRHMPINGVIIAVSILDLIKKDEAGREAHAQELRDRIEEMANRLEVQLPVYLMFTKCDMISGFKKFFGTLHGNEKDQILGATFNWPPAPGVDVAELFRDELAGIRPGITTHRLRVVGQGLEADAVKSVRFPSQLARVTGMMEQFVGALFRSGRIRDCAGLRGFYLTSGTQPGAEGESGEQAAKPSEPDYAAIAAAATAQASGGGGNAFEGSIFVAPSGAATGVAAAPEDRSSGMFLKNLFARVIIPDASLVRFSLARLRRQRLLSLLCRIGSPVVAVLIMVMIISSYLGSLSVAGDARDLIGKMRDDRRAGLEALPLRVERIDALRRLMNRIDRDSPPGLGDLRNDLALAYYRHLGEVVLRPAAAGVAAELQAEGADEDLRALYELYVAYKALGGDVQEGGGEAFARTMRISDRWLAGLNGADAETLRLVNGQLDQLVAHEGDAELWAVDLDQALLDRLTVKLADSLLIQQGYDQVLRSVSGLRPDISRDSLVTGSYRELLVNDTVVPGVFAHSAWHDLVMARLESESQDLEGRFTELGKPMESTTIMQRLSSLFRNDHDRAWLEFIRSTSVAPTRTLREASKNLGIIAGPQSPYRELLRGAWREAAYDFSTTVEGVDEDMAWYEEVVTRLAELEEAVQRFEGATDFGDRSSDLDEVERLVRTIEDTRLSVSAGLRAIPKARLQAAVRVSTEAVIGSVFDALANELADEQNALWRERVSARFAADIAERYPFAADAEQQLPLAAFAGFFNPTDGALTERVAAVERLRELKALDRSLLEVSRSYERAIKRLKAIHAVLFEDGAAPMMAFTVALQQRQGVKDMAMTVAGKKFSLYDSPTPRTRFAWAAGAEPGAKVAISIPSEQWLQIVDDGPWGLFKVLDQATVERRNTGDWLATWSFTSAALGEGARFQAGAVFSGAPIDVLFDQRDLLGAFVCPDQVTP